MAQITLTKGLTTEIDDEDLELVNKHKWCAQEVYNGKHYAVTSIRDKNGKPQKVYLHRLLMNPPDDLVVDHKDTNPLNNTRSNLRVCTHDQNIAAAVSNSRGNKTSSYRGVSYVASGRKHWKATLVYDRAHIYLGTFATEEEAAKARDAKAVELLGEFAVLNFPQEPHGDN